MRLKLQNNLTLHSGKIRSPIKRKGVMRRRKLLQACTRIGDCSKNLRLLTATAALAIFALLPLRNVNGQMPQPFVATPTAESASFDRKESVLDRMRAYKGEKTREAVTALFIQTDPSFSQEPSILLSNGTATARVTLRVPNRKGELPKFSITGGHCVSAQLSDQGVWILVIQPNPGTMATSVTVLSGGTMVEYPLTVAPPLNLLDPQKAEIIEIEYAVIANELAAARTAPGRP